MEDICQTTDLEPLSGMQREGQNLYGMKGRNNLREWRRKEGERVAFKLVLLIRVLAKESTCST